MAAAKEPVASTSTSALASSSGSRGLPSHTAPTILSTLHSLLLSAPNVPGALDHPLAPASAYGSWRSKGKSRALDPVQVHETVQGPVDGGDKEMGSEKSRNVSGRDEEIRMLEDLRRGMEAAKGILERGRNNGDGQKLARAMKDV